MFRSPSFSNSDDDDDDNNQTDVWFDRKKYRRKEIYREKSVFGREHHIASAKNTSSGTKKKTWNKNDSKVNVEIANIIVIKFIVNRMDENIKSRMTRQW